MVGIIPKGTDYSRNLPGIGNLGTGDCTSQFNWTKVLDSEGNQVQLALPCSKYAFACAGDHCLAISK